MPKLSAPNQGRAQALLGSSILFLILPFPFVFMRLWARWMKKTRLAINDYLVLLALLFTSGYNAAMIVASVRGGYGQHIWTLSVDEIMTNMKLSVTATFLWPTANSLIKLSVLHFYKTVFDFQGRLIVFSVYAVGTLTLLYWSSTVITALAICRPFAFNWDKITITGTCGDLKAYYLSTGVCNLIIDVMIVGLPLPVLSSLQMPRHKKASVIAIFSLGGIICILSIVRVVAIAKLEFEDVMYNIVLCNIMTALEPTLGVINACLPLLQPVVTRLGNSKVFP
ncbi:hypothetical protein DM02DRAFT_627119 [Periconia macrospinosa]|uniref:Rhodopsin domain-containing protein n=1 Tax=Periconia macrospinosa TaxID=97972 RepID=A0A2V1DV62_9PLEO|nr:hypothetical protein DM02DRAFT_627119 [Periconia macrospinosa]